MYEADEILSKVKRIHFIGIGGSGMCPIAEILHSEGYILSGSDNNESDTLNRIRALGIPVVMGQKAENIEGAEMIVHTAAIMDDNPELIAARASGIPTFERSKILGALSRRYENCIGICGTHGKTTTTSMTTQILIESGLDPSAVIGGKLPYTGTNGIVGKSGIFVCESCEYKNTFLQMSPKCAVILNIDADHMEFFKTMENLKKSFTRFADSAETVIYNLDDKNICDAINDMTDKNKEFITFGLGENCMWRAELISDRKGAYPEYDVYYKGEKKGHVVLNVPGDHNVYNSLAALASSVYAGCDIGTAIKEISDFKGAGRRFENLGTYKGITICDDYAHHPKELRVTLEAAKKLDYKRVIAVFQPFTYSRTAMLLNDFAEVLKIPDKVVMTEIMGSREKNTYGIHTSDLSALIPGSVWFNTFREVADYVESIAEEGDLVITLGCGDIYKAAKLMIEDLK